MHGMNIKIINVQHCSTFQLFALSDFPHSCPRTVLIRCVNFRETQSHLINYYISFNEFYPSRKKNLENVRETIYVLRYRKTYTMTNFSQVGQNNVASMGRNTNTPLNKVWLSINRL
jgi:hypothetical protein